MTDIYNDREQRPESSSWAFWAGLGLVMLVIWAGSALVVPLHALAAYRIVGVVMPVDDCESDSDGDGLKNCEEDKDKDGVVDEGETDPNNPDTDGDGILDGEEGDRDADGVLGPEETDPTNSDTDGDGVTDGEEKRVGTKPNVCDTDEDGLSDGVELGDIQPNDVNGCHGLMAAGSNYANPYVMDPLNPDSDGDGVNDGEEETNGNGWVDPDETDPSIVDTDRDGLDDGVETNLDFDKDGLPDFDYTLVKGEGECMPPASMSDLDCDGVPNARDDDSDNDGCPDAQEGGWIDSNANGISDVYDNEAKLCTEPSTDTGTTTTGDTEDEESSGVGEGPKYALDGGACSLIISSKKPFHAGGLSIFLMIFISISIFSTARPLIRQIY